MNVGKHGSRYDYKIIPFEGSLIPCNGGVFWLVLQAGVTLWLVEDAIRGGSASWLLSTPPDSLGCLLLVESTDPETARALVTIWPSLILLSAGGLVLTWAAICCFPVSGLVIPIPPEYWGFIDGTSKGSDADEYKPETDVEPMLFPRWLDINLDFPPSNIVPVTAVEALVGVGLGVGPGYRFGICFTATLCRNGIFPNLLFSEVEVSLIVPPILHKDNREVDFSLRLPLNTLAELLAEDVEELKIIPVEMVSSEVDDENSKIA